jgi:hypothetical protein
MHESYQYANRFFPHLGMIFDYFFGINKNTPKPIMIIGQK